MCGAGAGRGATLACGPAAVSEIEGGASDSATEQWIGPHGRREKGGRAVRFAGLQGEGRAGLSGKGKRDERVGLSLFFSSSSISFPFLTQLNYLNSKTTLNSSTYALKPIKQMHQHVCTNKLALKINFNYLYNKN